jgi:hypothetical protein
LQRKGVILESKYLVNQKKCSIITTYNSKEAVMTLVPDETIYFSQKVGELARQVRHNTESTMLTVAEALLHSALDPQVIQTFIVDASSAANERVCGDTFKNETVCVRMTRDEFELLRQTLGFEQTLL